MRYHLSTSQKLVFLLEVMKGTKIFSKRYNCTKAFYKR